MLAEQTLSLPPGFWYWARPLTVVRDHLYFSVSPPPLLQLVGKSRKGKGEYVGGKYALSLAEEGGGEKFMGWETKYQLTTYSTIVG